MTNSHSNIRLRLLLRLSAWAFLLISSAYTLQPTTTTTSRTSTSNLFRSSTFRRNNHRTISTRRDMVLTTPESIIEQASTQNLLDYLIDESVRTSARRPIMMQFDPRSGWIWKRWKGTVFSETWDSCVTKMIYAWAVFVLCRTYPGIKEFLSGFNILWAQLLSVTTFTLTFFVNQSYALWRKCYELSRRLQGRLHDLDMTLACHARRNPPADPNEPTTYTSGSRQVLELVSRWVRLFNLLTYASFTRSHRPILTPRGLRRLVERGLMTAKEREVLVDADLPATQRHNAVLLWIIRAFIEGCDAGHFHGGAGFEEQFLEKAHVCRAQYGAIGDELHGRMPLAYAHIVQVLVDLVLWMYPFMAIASNMSGLLCVLGTGLLTIGYQGLFDLAKQFLDPYDNESYGKGEDPLVVDTLIAETNSGSTRWMNSLAKFPVSSQLIQSGNLQDNLLPASGYTVAEWEQMEEERIRKERELQEQYEREEAERRLVEEHERLVREAADSMAELQTNATSCSAHVPFQDVRISVAGPRDTCVAFSELTVATTDEPTSQLLSQFITDASALEGAFPEDAAPPGTALAAVIKREASTVVSIFDETSTSAVEDEHILREEVGTDDSKVTEDSDVKAPQTVADRIQEGIIQRELEKGGVDEALLAAPERIDDSSEEASSSSSPEVIRSLEALGDSIAEASTEQTSVDVREPVDKQHDIPVENGLGRANGDGGAHEDSLQKLDEESIDAEEGPTPKPGSLTLEDYARQVDEILQAEREEMLETQAILNAPCGAESVEIPSSDLEESLELANATNFEESPVREEATTNLPGDTEMSGDAPLTVDEEQAILNAPPGANSVDIPDTETEETLTASNTTFPDNTPATLDTTEALKTTDGDAIPVDSRVDVVADRGDTEGPVPAPSLEQQLEAASSTSGDESASTPIVSHPQADKPPTGEAISESIRSGADIGSRLSAAEPMTAEEFERQRDEIIQAAREELLETEAILNAPPGANSLEIPAKDDADLSVANATEPEDDLAVLEMDAPMNVTDLDDLLNDGGVDEELVSLSDTNSTAEASGVSTPEGVAVQGKSDNAAKSQ